MFVRKCSATCSNTAASANLLTNTMSVTGLQFSPLVLSPFLNLGETLLIFQRLGYSEFTMVRLTRWRRISSIRGAASLTPDLEIMGEAGKPLPRKKIRLAESFWVYITLFCCKFRICRESHYYLGLF